MGSSLIYTKESAYICVKYHELYGAFTSLEQNETPGGL